MSKRVGIDEASVSGIMLRREGDYAVVEVERKLADGTYHWFELIREHIEGQFSHIAEPSKIVSLYWDGKQATR